MNTPFEIKFNNVGEIRMGSPYSMCSVEIVGSGELEKWKNEFIGDCQNLFCWSDDYNYLCLVKWHFEKEKPGFNLIIFNRQKKTKTTSDRIPGCCKTIEFENGKFWYESFLYSSIEPK